MCLGHVRVCVPVSEYVCVHVQVCLGHVCVCACVWACMSLCVCVGMYAYTIFTANLEFHEHNEDLTTCVDLAL